MAKYKVKTMKKIFVTGSAGFVGKNLVEMLRREGHEVVEFDFAKNPEHDITNLGQLVKYMEGDAVIHLASKTQASESIKNPHPYMKVIIMGTANILEAVRLKGIKRLVYISSCGIKGMTRDGNPYHWSKYMAEGLCQMYSEIYGLEVVVLRPTIMYGPHNWKGVVHTFTERTRKGETLHIYGDGSQTRDFLYVRDSCRAMIKAATQKVEGKFRILEIGTGKATSIKELAEMISDNVVFHPDKPSGISSSIADIRDAKRYLNWKPKIKIKDVIKNEREKSN